MILRNVVLVTVIAAMGVAGCAASQASRPADSQASLPEPPLMPGASRGGGGGASEADVRAVAPAVGDLVQHANAGDRAYIGALMPGANPEAIDDMIARIRRSDLPATFPGHLMLVAGAYHLNYHDPAHFQVDLAQANGRWVVSRLWFCR